MENFVVGLLSFVVFLPAVAALFVLPLIPRDKPDVMRWFTLGITVVVFLVTAWIAYPGQYQAQFDRGAAQMQQTFSLAWISSFNIFYFMGLDGISFPLVVLTSFLCVLAMGASWNITKHVKAYCILFLLLEDRKSVV